MSQSKIHYLFFAFVLLLVGLLVIQTAEIRVQAETASTLDANEWNYLPLILGFGGESTATPTLSRPTLTTTSTFTSTPTNTPTNTPSAIKTASSTPSPTSVPSEPFFPEPYPVRPSDSNGNLVFGESVDLDGGTSIIGAPGADAAYIYTRNGETWSQQQKLSAPDGNLEDQIGHSVALDGDTAIVGAYSGTQGAVYVFTRSGTTWSQQQKLVPNNRSENDRFGYSVALDGDTAVICTPWDSAYVFTRSGSTWNQQQKMSPIDGEYFCAGPIALDGNTVIIGCPRSTYSGPGAAYVFTRSGTSWSQQQRITSPDDPNGGYFGIAVALDGDTAIVGDRYTKAGSHGTSYVFTRSGAVWSQK